LQEDAAINVVTCIEEKKLVPNQYQNVNEMKKFPSAVCKLRNQENLVKYSRATIAKILNQSN